MNKVEQICDDLSRIPSIPKSWNDWLAGYSFVTLQDSNRTLKVSQLPNYNGQTAIDFRNHLLTIYNNDRKHLLLIGVLLEKNNVGRAIELIQNSEVSDLFFPRTQTICANVPPSSQRPQGQSPFAAATPTPVPRTALQQLAERASNKSEAALKSVLIGPASRKVRELVPWLLPEDATLLTLVERQSDAWLDLIVVLVQLAESKLGRVQFTFLPTSNPKGELRNAIAKIKREAPPLELLIYDPTMDAESREMTWRAEAFDLVDPQELLNMAGEEDSEWQHLHPDHQETLFQDFTLALRTDSDLLERVMRSATQLGHRVAQLDALEDTLFPPKQRTAFAVRSQFELPAVAWSVEGCVDAVSRRTGMAPDTAAALKQTLNVWHTEGLFAMATERMLHDTLAQSGANATEILLIVKDLIQNEVPSPSS